MQPPVRVPLVPSAYPDTWGLVDSALRPLFDVDTYLEVSYKAKTKVSQFPVEKGGFVDYNKVQEPADIKMRVAVGGDSAKMEAFLLKLDTEKNSVNLYRALTPEVFYKNMTLVGYDYKRTQDKGRNSIIADLELVEVREVTPQYASVKLPPIKAKDSKNSPDKKKTGQTEAEKDNASLKGKSAQESALIGFDKAGVGKDTVLYRIISGGK